MPKTNSPIVEHAGSGLRMPEATARKIDELSKDLPKDFTYRRIAKAVDSNRVDAGERTDVSVISTADIDREGDVILPSAGDWSEYNHVVPWAHDYEALPVGSNWWIKESGGKLIAKTHYAPKPADWGDGPWMPSAILHLMQQPVPTCTGKSVGVIPLHIRTPTREEIAANPAMRNVKKVVDRWKGLEYSCCAVPVLAEAEMQTVSKCERDGMVSPQFASLIRKSMLQYVRPSSKSNPAQSMANYSHISFKAPKEVQKAHKEGVERHAAGECKGQATPEMVAMAKHVADGGDVSAEYCRKCMEYHKAFPTHATAAAGTVGLCLSMLHGGAHGAAHYEKMVKAMDEADATPDTAVSENSVSADAASSGDTVTKAAGASEDNAADGGNIVPTETKVIEEPKPEPVTEPVKKAVETPPAKPALTPQQISDAAERELQSRMPAIMAKAMKIAEDKAILAMGGV